MTKKTSKAMSIRALNSKYKEDLIQVKKNGIILGRLRIFNQDGEWLTTVWSHGKKIGELEGRTKDEAKVLGGNMLLMYSNIK
jgi:hypothetical protein